MCSLLNVSDCTTTAGIALLMLVAASSNGCDRTRTTKQVVRVKVLDKHESLPARNVTVKIKWSREDAIAEYGKDNVTSQANWENFLWHEGVSDSAGIAVVEVIQTALDGTRGNTTSPSYDWVLDREFILKLESMDGQIEEVQLLMKPGESGESESFIVEIEDIGKTEYVN